MTQCTRFSLQLYVLQNSISTHFCGSVNHFHHRNPLYTFSLYTHTNNVQEEVITLHLNGPACTYLLHSCMPYIHLLFHFYFSFFKLSMEISLSEGLTLIFMLLREKVHQHLIGPKWLKWLASKISSQLGAEYFSGCLSGLPSCGKNTGSCHQPFDEWGRDFNWTPLRSLRHGKQDYHLGRHVLSCVRRSIISAYSGPWLQIPYHTYWFQMQQDFGDMDKLMVFTFFLFPNHWKRSLVGWSFMFLDEWLCDIAFTPREERGPVDRLICTLYSL